MPTILFLPAGVRIEAEPGESLRDVALRAGVALASTCGGVASCGLCKVRIAAGAEHLSPLTLGERDKLGNVFFITRERLACQTHASGEVTCEVPDEATERQRRADRARKLPPRPIERLRSKAGR